MQYSEGKLGRIFVLRLDQGEDLIESIQNFIKIMNVETGMMLFLGALKDGKAVSGPERPVIPPVPHFESFDSAWEVFGMATIYASSAGSQIHVHSSLGRGRDALVGCIREKASVYLIIEAVLIEFKNLKGKRELDMKTGLYLPSLEKVL